LEVAGLVILVVASLVVRGYDLERIPANLGGDEGTQAAAGLQLMRAPLGNPFSTGWYSVPTMSLLAYGVSMRVFGATVSGLRALSALIGTATVLATFLLARELWDRRVAWVSAGLLAFGHYHIHFSRLGSNQVADPLFAALALWLVARALRTRRFFAFAATGAVVGLGWYGYFGARLVGVVVACYLGLQAVLRRKFLERYGLHVTILLASALVVAAPLLLHYLAHPGELVSRPRQVNIFASEWLARERVITGRSTLSLLLEQFWKSISAFNYTLDPTFWYRASIPLLDIITGLLFVVGLLWTLGHRRRAASQLLLLWFWLALILGWVVTENPPSSQRMVIIAPALALLAGLGLDWVLQVVEPLFAGRGALASGVAAVVVGAAAGVNLHYYFLEYTSTRVYGNPTAEMTTVLARQLTEEDDDRRVYLHGAPHVYWEFGTLRFLARGIEGEDVPPPDGGEAVGLDVSQGARFIFHPERLNELKDVRGRFPGGEATYVHSSADGELLYAMYELGA
jgi:4-amino-4-deoxy-L-arabinose transferase-like glycosyltransferase